MNTAHNQRKATQCTLASSASVSGFGYWSGRDVTVEFRPAPANAGITFVRRDLGPQARIPVRADLRLDIPRRTSLARQDARVEMVEHVLAALVGLEIDNCEVWVDQPEMPGCDGSALAFVQALQSAGKVDQGLPAKQLVVTESIRISEGDSWIEAHPPSGDSHLATGDCQLSIEFQLHYPHNARIGRQSIYCQLSPEVFSEELAPCRTFLLEEEAAEMTKRGIGTRVTTADLLVFGEDGPIDNPLRFANECARHKALDVVGDLALTGHRISANVVAYRSSHRLNTALSERLISQFSVSPLANKQQESCRGRSRKSA